MEVTAEDLWEWFDFDPLSGKLTWRIAPPFRPALAGKVAGGPTHNQGYWQIKFKQKLYLAHRLVWLWMYGDWPTAEVIDHIDGNVSNNCAWNLRQVSQKENVRSGRSCKHNEA